MTLLLGCVWFADSNSPNQVTEKQSIQSSEIDGRLTRKLSVFNSQ